MPAIGLGINVLPLFPLEELGSGTFGLCSPRPTVQIAEIYLRYLTKVTPFAFVPSKAAPFAFVNFSKRMHFVSNRAEVFAFV